MCCVCGCKAGFVTCNCPLWCHLCFCQPGAWLVAARAGATTYKVQNPSQPVSGVSVAHHVNLDCFFGAYSNGGNNRAPTGAMVPGQCCWLVVIKRLQRCCDHWSMVVEMRPCCNAGRMETSMPGPGSTLPWHRRW